MKKYLIALGLAVSLSGQVFAGPGQDIMKKEYNNLTSEEVTFVQNLASGKVKINPAARKGWMDGMPPQSQAAKVWAEVIMQAISTKGYNKLSTEEVAFVKKLSEFEEKYINKEAIKTWLGKMPAHSEAEKIWSQAKIDKDFDFEKVDF